MLDDTPIFIVGTPTYRDKPSSGSPFDRISKVLVAAARNYNRVVPEDPKELYEVDMTPLPPKDQRNPWLRYQVEGYTEDIMHTFEQRLETIIGRSVNWVHVLDFAGLTEEMRETLAGRLRMIYTGDEGQDVRAIPDKGDLRDYWIKISSDRDFLGLAPSYVYIRDPVRRLCHMMISCSISGRGRDDLTIVPEDNAACIAQLKDGYIKGDKTKHILPKFFFTHDLQKSGDIIVQKIRSGDNQVDLFTKALPTTTFKKLVHDTGMRRLNQLKIFQASYNYNGFVVLELWGTMLLGQRRLLSVFSKAATYDVLIEISDYLSCKNILDIICGPVITPSGLAYERAVILDYLEKHLKTRRAVKDMSMKRFEKQRELIERLRRSEKSSRGNGSKSSDYI
ncbi:retrotransposon like protein [Tanacetum coccineum]